MVQYQLYADIKVCSPYFLCYINDSYVLIPPTSRRKLTRNKKVARYAAWTGIVLIYALGYCALASGPEIVEYEGYLVTAESLAMIQGYQQAAERVHKQDGYQPIATAE